jgi:hypothetical protein
MLADHSVFINEMLLQERNGQPDNGNLDFTYEAIEWLRDGRRDRVLIIEDGEIQSDLHVRLTADPQALRKLLRALTPKLNQALLNLQAKHQQEHVLDEKLVEGINVATGKFPFGRPRAQNYYLLLIALAAGGLVVLGFTRLLRASHRGNLAPAFTAFGNRRDAPSSSLALRETSALAGEELREYAREAVREWFVEMPGCPTDMNWTNPPRIESRSGWWRRSSIRRELLSLWGLAIGDPAPRMSQRHFDRLLARLDVLRKQMEAGELRIDW